MPIPTYTFPCYLFGGLGTIFLHLAQLLSHLEESPSIPFLTFKKNKALNGPQEDSLKGIGLQQLSCELTT